MRRKIELNWTIEFPRSQISWTKPFENWSNFIHHILHFLGCHIVLCNEVGRMCLTGIHMRQRCSCSCLSYNVPHAHFPFVLITLHLVFKNCNKMFRGLRASIGIRWNTKHWLIVKCGPSIDNNGSRELFYHVSDCKFFRCISYRSAHLKFGSDLAHLFLDVPFQRAAWTVCYQIWKWTVCGNDASGILDIYLLLILWILTELTMCFVAGL